MNYITTNIRLPKEDYMRLKQEAAAQRKSLSAVIREKLGAQEVKRSKAEIEAFLKEVKREAEEAGRMLKDKNFNSTEFIRQDRDSDHGHSY